MNPEKKLKLILASLKDKEILKFFEVFANKFPDQFRKTVRQISFNCYQSVCQFRNKVVSGYGKNSQESYINSLRSLTEMLVEDLKLHEPMRESLRVIQQLTGSDSQNKLLTLDRQILNSMKNVGYPQKPSQKRVALKEQIFESLNLDNLKISNPNATHKAKCHQKYMSQSIKNQDCSTLEEVYKSNKELQRKLYQAKQENATLKLQLRQFKQNNVQNLQKVELEKIKVNSNENAGYQQKKLAETHQPLKPRTNDYLNISQDTKVLEKSKLRSVSVEASQTQKYSVSKSQDKKIVVPKLNLQVLPNYHGKSNKSLNQSLMEVYQKTHIK